MKGLIERDRSDQVSHASDGRGLDSTLGEIGRAARAPSNGDGGVAWPQLCVANSDEQVEWQGWPAGVPLPTDAAEARSISSGAVCGVRLRDQCPGQEPGPGRDGVDRS